MAIGTAGAILAAGAMGAGASLYGASKQAQAAGDAAAVQQHMYDTTRADLAPYNQGGQKSFVEANKLLLGSPGQVQAQLEGLPGYQFAKTQGLKSVQNSAAARGLGVSGAALKGAASYATGLADQTYGEQFNRLMASAGLGENAAAHTGNAGSQAATGIGNALIQQGNAYAGGAAGVASGLGQGLLGYGMYSAGTTPGLDGYMAGVVNSHPELF